MTKKTAVTYLGIQEIINVAKNGTEKVKLTTIKVSPDSIDVTPSLTDIPNVIFTCEAVAGANVGDGLIHVSGVDGSQDTYTAHTIGLYTEKGTLFAVVSSDEALFQKVKLSGASIAIDIPITSVDPEYIDFGDACFINPPATTETAGVVKIATEKDILDGLDNSKAVSPYALKTALKKNSDLLHSEGNETIKGKKKFEEDINGNILGNSATTTKLKTPAKINGTEFDGSKDIIIPLPPYIATQLLRDKTKNYGNDYYDDSDITSLIYAGNGSGTVRAELAAGNFERLHPGQYIKGRVTGTTYVVVGCNVYLNRGDTLLTRNHLGLIPIQLVGNSGSLLWSGQRWTGDTTKNTVQGYAPWNADNENVGKNVTCAYKDSYMAKTVIPKVINNWLKKDFEDQGISILTFRNLFSTGFDANLPCMSYPSWKGACIYDEWADCKAVLMSEPEVYGGYRWASSPYDSHMQHLQLPIFRHRSLHEIAVADIWLKDVASVSSACNVNWAGYASNYSASYALRVCPLFLIA